jgi:hypothetical protein
MNTETGYPDVKPYIQIKSVQNVFLLLVYLKYTNRSSKSQKISKSP